MCDARGGGVEYSVTMKINQFTIIVIVPAVLCLCGVMKIGVPVLGRAGVP